MRTYLSQDVEDAKTKARDWMRTSLLSHLRGASASGWLTRYFSESELAAALDEWSRNA